MKVQTDLKAGSFVQETAKQVEAGWGQALSFVDRANLQAKRLTGSALQSSSTVASWLASALRQQ